MADAVRVVNSTTALVDTKFPGQMGLCYNATQDAFYFAAPSSGTTWKHYKVTWGMSASEVGSSFSIQTNHSDWQSAVDDNEYIVTAYATAVGYTVGRFTISTETFAANTTIGAPGALTRRIRIGTTGTDSMVVVYHGVNEKVHGTNYERLYYRTYTPSTDTLGAETLVSGTSLAAQDGQQNQFTLDNDQAPAMMRGDYTQDRAWFKWSWPVGGGATTGGYYDASAGWTGLNRPTNIRHIVHLLDGTDRFFFIRVVNQVQWLGWAGGETGEAVAGTTVDHNTLLHPDHATDEIYVTQASSTTNMRRKKRSSGGTWDTSWTNDSVTLTAATAIRTANTNDAILMEKSGTKYLVRTVLADQSSGRGLHLVRMALSTPPVTGQPTASNANRSSVSAQVFGKKFGQVAASAANASNSGQRLYINGAVTASSANTSTANAQVTSLVTGQVSAPNANFASTAAALIRLASTSANAANTSTVATFVKRLGVTSANAANSATTDSVVFGKKFGALSADTANAVSVSAQVFGLKEGAPVASNANSAAIDSSVRLAGATSSNAANTSSLTALRRRLGATTAPSANAATATASLTLASQVTAPAANTSTADSGLLVIGQVSASNANTATAQATTGGQELGQASAPNANTSTVAARVAFVGQVTAPNANAVSVQATTAGKELGAAVAANANTTAVTAGVRLVGQVSASGANTSTAQSLVTKKGAVSSNAANAATADSAVRLHGSVVAATASACTAAASTGAKTGQATASSANSASATAYVRVTRTVVGASASSAAISPIVRRITSVTAPIAGTVVTDSTVKRLGATTAPNANTATANSALSGFPTGQLSADSAVYTVLAAYVSQAVLLNEERRVYHADDDREYLDLDTRTYIPPISPSATLSG